jgi:hypothetical protein
VDPQGLHAFMLAGHEIYYNNFHNSSVHQVKVAVGDQSSQVGIKSVDILKFSESDPNFFEMVVGTEEGHIYLGAVQVDAQNGKPLVLEPFKQVI